MFWFTAVLLIIVATAFPVLALLRRAGDTGDDDTSAADVKFYRDQLLAIDTEVSRAVISESEAKSAKVEISRRLLEADKRAAAATSKKTQSGMHPLVAALTAAAMVALTFVLYQTLGAGGLADQPIAERLVAAEELRVTRPSQAQAQETVPPRAFERDPEHVALVERLREALETRPDDLQGHVLLAGNEARLGNFAEAARAQVSVVRIKGAAATAEDFADLADLMILAAGGYVSPEAETALRAALDLDPQNGTARYYLGLMFAQTDRADLAFRFWRALLEESPSDAPWVPAIRAEIMAAAQLAGIRYELPPETSARSGPSQQDINAASEMSAEERAAMIAGMVAGLDARLSQDGGSVDEWVRLILARAQLGEIDAARTAVDRARAAFTEDAAALDIINEAAQRVGAGE